jgi:hypothetical protein
VAAATENALRHVNASAEERMTPKAKFTFVQSSLVTEWAQISVSRKEWQSTRQPGAVVSDRRRNQLA